MPLAAALASPPPVTSGAMSMTGTIRCGSIVVIGGVLFMATGLHVRLCDGGAVVLLVIVVHGIKKNLRLPPRIGAAPRIEHRARGQQRDCPDRAPTRKPVMNRTLAQRFTTSLAAGTTLSVIAAGSLISAMAA